MAEDRAESKSSALMNLGLPPGLKSTAPANTNGKTHAEPANDIDPLVHSLPDLCAANPGLAALLVRLARAVAPDGERQVGPLATLSAGAGSTANVPTPIADEAPAYKWVSTRPYRHHRKWRVWFRRLDGDKTHRTFDTEESAAMFLQQARAKLLPNGGHPVRDVLVTYLDARKPSLKPSSLRTLEFRIRAVIQGRELVAVEVFPWLRAWSEHARVQSVDSQHGILAAVRGLIDHCVKAGFLQRDPLAEVQVIGHKRRGKKQLRIDESRRFVAEALRTPDDPLAIACATMVYTGLRPGEVMALQVRDLDAGGSILRIEEGKTMASRRGVEVAEVFRPFLLAISRGRRAENLLFEFKPRRTRVAKDPRKRRVDALLRRTKSICEAAGLPVVRAHSMRGLHSTLAAGFGATGHAVAMNLGHTSFATTTKRHYVDRAVLENASLRKNLQVLRIAEPNPRWPSPKQ